MVSLTKRSLQSMRCPIIFVDQAVFDFSSNKVPFVSILPPTVLHVRLMYVKYKFRVCKIQFFFFFFGFFAISNIHYHKLFRCSLGSSRKRMSTVLFINYYSSKKLTCVSFCHKDLKKHLLMKVNI